MKRLLVVPWIALILCAQGSRAAEQPGPADSVDVAKAIPVRSQAQAGVKDLIEKGLYKKALQDWSSAYGLSSFSSMATGRGLYAFVLFRTGLRALALQKLFEIQDPNQISTAVKSLWMKELPYQNSLWRDFSVQWNEKWLSVFSAQVGNTIKAWRKGLPETKTDFSSDSNLLSQLSLDNPARSYLIWQLGLGSTVRGDTTQALSYFQILLDSDQNVVPQDEIVLASARLFYQDNKFAAAMKYDNKLQKDSDYWLEAMEEKAWAEIRLGNDEAALSLLKTLTVPFFTNQLGPEPYYLSGLADIRVCDFAGAFKTLKLFKDRFRSRVVDLQKISNDKVPTSSVTKALDQLEQDNSISGMSGDMARLPRLYQRDNELNRLAVQGRLFQEDAQTLSEILAEASQQNTEVVFLKVLADRNQSEIRQKSILRMKVLAQRDVGELSHILTKLHIVEIEAIQRMYPTKLASKSGPAKPSTPTNIQMTGNTVTFPADGEVWLDELDHYSVRAKGCSGKGGQAL